MLSERWLWCSITSRLHVFTHSKTLYIAYGSLLFRSICHSLGWTKVACSHSNALYRWRHLSELYQLCAVSKTNEISSMQIDNPTHSHTDNTVTTYFSNDFLPMTVECQTEDYRFFVRWFDCIYEHSLCMWECIVEHELYDMVSSIHLLSVYKRNNDKINANTEGKNPIFHTICTLKSGESFFIRLV